MSDFFAPLTPEYALLIPEEIPSLIGWVLWFGLLVFALIRWRDRNFKLNRPALIWLASLSLLVLFLTPFFGILIDLGLGMDAGESPIKHLMVFAAVPWLLASGMLGMLPAAMLAGISGLLLAYLDTHNIFTPLVFMTLSLLFSGCVRQRYRTLFYRLARFPLFGAIFSLVIGLPFIFLAQVLSLSGELGLRVIAAFKAMPDLIIATGGMMVIGGFVCVMVWLIAKKIWGSSGPLVPAPGETSLKYRLITTTLPIMVLLLIVVVAVNWRIAENNARRLLVSRLTSTSSVVAEGLSSFLNVGESLILNMAEDDRLISDIPEDVEAVLAQKMESSAYFEQLVLLGSNGERLAHTPLVEEINMIPDSNETSAIEAVSSGASLRVIPTSSETDENSALIGYFVGIKDSGGQTTRILWGRTSLGSNDHSRSLLNALEDLEKSGGLGQIVTGDGTILYHTDPQQIMTTYSGSIYNTPTYFENNTENNVSMMHYYQPVTEQGWAVVTSLPEQALQMMAWQTIYPLILIAASAVFVVLLVTLLGLSPALKEIDQLKDAAEKLARGNYDVDLAKSRVKGELGVLNRAFQDMLTTLSGRMRKQTDLLSVSEKMSDHLNLQDSLRVIMESALERGVSSVRIVLQNGSDYIVPEGSDTHFGLGKHARLFSALDGEILSRTHAQGPMVLRDFQVGKVLHLKKGMPYPASMIAMPLEWDKRFLGILWVTYQEKRSPSVEEVDFFKSLSHKASTAVVNARAYDQSVTTLKQLEAVLNSLPDAVLISDSESHVIYQNQAAQSIFGKREGSLEGKALLPLFEDEDLAELYEQGDQEVESKEIRFADGKTYHVIVSPIEVEGGLLGHATVFKDITHHKVQESRKTEFVTTVSHELRSPLTLIHGYAKILRLTGNLNEQQDTYISNIIDGIEEMKDLVQNLLDMGRLESGDSLEMTRATVSEIAKKAVDSMDAQAKQKNIQMKLSLPDDSFVIEADVTFLIQALKNLLENAIKFTKMGGEVSLSVRRKEQDVVFAVRDNGIGIAPLDQRHLFKKFRRINAGVGQEQKGSGLGLAIVKSIAERHAGKVWVESQLGKGSTFYLQIPIKSLD